MPRPGSVHGCQLQRASDRPAEDKPREPKRCSAAYAQGAPAGDGSARSRAVPCRQEEPASQELPDPRLSIGPAIRLRVEKALPQVITRRGIRPTIASLACQVNPATASHWRTCWAPVWCAVFSGPFASSFPQLLVEGRMAGSLGSCYSPEWSHSCSSTLNSR